MLVATALLLGATQDAFKEQGMLPMEVYKDLDVCHRDSEAFARVEKWITDGGNVNAEEAFQGGTMLHTAAARGNKQMTSLLLQYKANPNLHARNGATPLILASGKGHLPVVKALIEAGADPDFRDDRGVSALMYAESEERRIKKQHAGAAKGEHAIAKVLREANKALRAKEKMAAAKKKKEEL